ncbi:uncharacterized protein LOC131598115 [Vicia villosa]|uniref:uncharacterized protein LOC131598115 n=1 Tax=Vicia villosa TaxID=3911 RepID=UPI00273BF09A|nr:uncharacterized protein LOC131598115 [Vicia villosa]
MSSGSVKKISLKEIEQVQNLIERCMQLYMNPKEIVETLLIKAKIERGITESVPQNPSCYASEQSSAVVKKPKNMRHSTIHDVLNNGGSSLNTSMHELTPISARGNRINSPPSMLSSQPGCSGSPPYIFGHDGTVLEVCPTIGDAAVTSFNSVDSNSHSMNGALIDSDISSFGSLGQIPIDSDISSFGSMDISRNFSLSDLTADFFQSSD